MRTSSRAVVGRVNEVENTCLFGDDRVHAEHFVAFAVVGLSGGADPHTDHVHDLLEQRASFPGRVHG